MRYSSIRRRAGRGAGWIAAATLVVAVSLPIDANAMCCLCRDCSGAAYCVDGLANSLACSTFCFNNGCPSTVFDSVDTCAGGCDGAPDAPTATPSATTTQTPTITATSTATGTAPPASTPSSTPTDTGTATATATDSPTAVNTATSTPTGTATETGAASATPTATPSNTPSSTPTASPTVTAGTPSQLSGHIRYYAAPNLSVPGVTVVQSGTTPATAMTNASGNYGFSTAGPGNVTIQPQKNGDFDTAITSLDAVTVLQAIAGGFGVVLTPDQELAADVSGNGSFSTLDAALILQFQASIIDRLPAGDLCQSDWLFVPEPSPTPNQSLVQPVTGGGNCQHGAITLNPFTPPLAGRDFRAILIGDVTGNWAPPTPTP